MKKGCSILIIGLCLHCNVANGAVCVQGYYNNDDECAPCETGYYCPGDDTRIACPDDTSDWVAEYTARGYTVYTVGRTYIWSWLPNGDRPYSILHCHSGHHINTSAGAFYIEPAYNGTNYISPYDPMWYAAGIGYYLSSYRFTSWQTWYTGVKECTNAPANSHYTGPGTPDEPKSGGATDYNDCPWECDDGFGNHDDECVPLCGAGISRLHSGNGHKINLYPRSYSAPTLVLKYNDVMCYGVLQTGAANDAINISVGDAIYHLTN